MTINTEYKWLFGGLVIYRGCQGGLGLVPQPIQMERMLGGRAGGTATPSGFLDEAEVHLLGKSRGWAQRYEQNRETQGPIWGAQGRTLHTDGPLLAFRDPSARARPIGSDAKFSRCGPDGEGLGRTCDCFGWETLAVRQWKAAEAEGRSPGTWGPQPRGAPRRL